MSIEQTRLRVIERVLNLTAGDLQAVEQLLNERQRVAKGQTQNEIEWPHAPVHRISEHGSYMVTASTLDKQHYFRSRERLDFLQAKLLELAAQHGWQLEAWAVFSNHYHFVGHSLAPTGNLKKFLGHLHTATATEINRLDNAAGRQVWHNFFDSHLTFEKSYLARLNYVHQNAVKHGLVQVANQYRWCSAAWFERTATPAQVKTIFGFKTDKLRIPDDDFEVFLPED